MNNKMRIALVLLILCGFIVSGCRKTAPDALPGTSKNLTVSAAVSLKGAFGEIGEIYKSKNGGSLSFNFGASGALQRQIETGAPVDVFASAGETQMEELASKNLIDSATRRNFARNALVLIVPQNSQLNLTAFNDLTESEVQKIAVGNPKTVPAGQYTAQVFEKNNVENGLQEKLIYAEDVRQVLDYVVRGETDAGIVYASDALSAGDKVRVAAVAPEASHAPILYPVAVIKDGKNKLAAQEFIDLLSSPEGQSVLKKYGFANAVEK